MNQDDSSFKRIFRPKFYVDGDKRNPFPISDIRSAFWAAEREAFDPNGTVGLKAAIENGSDIVYGTSEDVAEEDIPEYLTSNEHPLQERIMLAYIRDFIPSIGWYISEDVNKALSSYFES